MIHRMSIVLAGFLGMAGAAPAAEPAVAHGRLVLLGARWCAPCMAELAALPRIVAAAGEETVVLAWVDRALPPPAGRVEIMPTAEARALAERLGGAGYGLPMATWIAPDGKVCAPWRTALRAQDVTSLIASCR